MAGFVIEYHRPTGDRRVHEFSGTNGSADALKYRLELEERRQDDDWEIASFNSDSIETLQKTHARYFVGHELANV